jgi:hypothetical protein
MSRKDKVARRKLWLLELASELSNVSRASQVIGTRCLVPTLRQPPLIMPFAPSK